MGQLCPSCSATRTARSSISQSCLLKRDRESTGEWGREQRRGKEGKGGGMRIKGGASRGEGRRGEGRRGEERSGGEEVEKTRGGG